MTSRQRVLAALQYQEPDRVPLNFFAGWNVQPRKRVKELYGSLDRFCELLHIDIFTGVVPRFPFGREHLRAPKDLEHFLRAPFVIDPHSEAVINEPCDGILNNTVAEALEKHQQEKAVFAHIWGLFELYQFLFEAHGYPGTEAALLHLALEREKTAEMFWKLGRWSAACVETVIEAGVDVIELSDDWGQQNTMMFSPKDWWEMISEPTKHIVDAATSRGVPVLLHSDGDITQVLDGIVQMGVKAIHPAQESAGMDLRALKENYHGKLSIMGGLDTVTALPLMSEEQIQREVERVFSILKPRGGYIFSASHMIQPDTRIEVVEAAYRRAYELSFYD